MVGPPYGLGQGFASSQEIGQTAHISVARAGGIQGLNRRRRYMDGPVRGHQQATALSQSQDHGARAPLHQDTRGRLSLLLAVHRQARQELRLTLVGAKDVAELIKLLGQVGSSRRRVEDSSNTFLASNAQSGEGGLHRDL